MPTRFSNARPRRTTESLSDSTPSARNRLRLVEAPDALSALSDEELMERHRDGIPGCFDVLVERYKRKLFGFLRRMGFTSARAEELTADVFFKVH